MSKLLTASLAAIGLALGIAGSPAQGAGFGMMQGGTQLAVQAGQPGSGPSAHGHMRQGRMGGPGMMASGMMGPGMMGSGMMAGGMMIVMMDANGDGSLSLDEFQAMHARMFKFLDANHDGQISADELNAPDGDDDQGAE